MLAKSYDRNESDEKAIFLKIYKTHYQVLYRHGLYLSNNKEITKDCIQQMFFELWSKTDRFATIDNIKPYLKKYLERKILKELSKSRELSTSDFSAGHKHDESYEASLIKNQQTLELQQSLERAIKCLTKRQVQLIELRFVNGYTFNEMGKMLGLQHRSMYNQLHSAMKILREKLKLFSTSSLFFTAATIL